MIRINLLGQSSPESGEKRGAAGSNHAGDLWPGGHRCSANGSWSDLLPAEAGAGPDQRENRGVARGTGQPAADQAGSGPVRSAEDGATATHRRDREPAEEPHRRAGITGDGGEHGGACRQHLADVAEPHREFDRTAGRIGFDQLGGEFHNAAQAFRIFRQRGDQVGGGRRYCAVG